MKNVWPRPMAFTDILKPPIDVELVKGCYTCFKCIGACPVGLKPSLLVKAYLGSFLQEFRDVYERVIGDQSIWHCAKCLKCFELCPQKVPLHEIIEYLQYEAAKQGIQPRSYAVMVENTMNTYVAFTSQTIVTKDGGVYSTEDARNVLGLDPFPGSQSSEKFKENVKKLMGV